MKKHAAINGANQHWPAADRRIIEVIAPSASVFVLATACMPPWS